MIILSLLLNLSCSEPIMKNESEQPWNTHDYKILRNVKVRCGQIYQDAPCVKLFWKTGVQSYKVVCGHED